MNSIIKSALVVIAVLMLAYMTTSFIVWEWEPRLWKEEDRFVTLLLGYTFGIALAVLLYHDDKDKK